MAIDGFALITGKKNKKKKDKELMQQKTPTKKETKKKTTNIGKDALVKAGKSVINTVTAPSKLASTVSSGVTKTIKKAEKASDKKYKTKTYDVYERGGKYYYSNGKKETEVNKKVVENALKNNRSGVIGSYNKRGKFSEVDEKGKVLTPDVIRKQKVKNLKKQVNAMASDVKNNRGGVSQAITDVANIVDAATDFGVGKNYKNAAKTAINTSTNLGTGALKTLENVWDSANDATSEIESRKNYFVNRAFGMSKDKAKQLMKEEQQANADWVARDLTNEFKDKTGYNEIRPQLEEGSLVKEENLGGKIAQGIGGMVPSLLVGQYANLGLTTTPTNNLRGIEKLATIGKNVGKGFLNQAGSNAVLGASSYGSGLEEAYRSGATGKQARLYGLGNAATELATEWITGGIPGTRSEGVLDNIIGDVIDSKTASISNKYIKGVARTILKSQAKGIGEGIEEALADIINPHLKNLTYSSGEKVDWNQVKESALSGYLIGMFLNSPETVDTLRQEINNTDIPQSRKQALNQELNTLVEQARQNVSQEVQEVTNQQEISPVMQQQANEVAQRVSTGEIDAQEGNALLEQIKDGTYNQNRNLETIATQEQQRLQQDLQDGLIDANEYTQNLNALNQTIQSERERINIPQENIQQETPSNNMSLEESAIQNNLDPNSETVQVVQKLMDNRGIQATFDADRFADSKTNAFWTIDDNGNRQVVFNPNATTNDIVEEIAIHELTHDLMSSENSKNALKSEEILNYVKTMEDYESARKNLEETYSQVYDKNDPNYNQLIDEEVVADVLGRKLGNQEYVNRLVTQKPSVAKRIFDWVKNKIVNSGGKIRNERLYWENVKNNFEKAYNMEYQKSNTTTNNKYSIKKTSDGMQYVEDNKLKQNSNLTERDVFNNIKNTEYKFEDGDKAYIIGWLKSNNKNVNNKAMYNELFARYPSIFKNIEDIKDFNKLVNYNTDELLKTSNKTQSEIEDINSKHKDWNIESFDTRRSILYDSTNNKAYIIDFSIANLKNGKKIAYAKKMAEANDNILNKIKTSVRSENSPIASSEENISQNNKIVKDNQGRTLTKEQQDYFKDSKIRDKNGNLKVMYHGTEGDFNVFDMKQFGGKNGTAEGFGIYLSDSPVVSDDYGNRMIEAYVNVTKPANTTDLTTTQQDVENCIKELVRKDAEQMVEDGDYDNINDALKDTWISNYTYTYDKSIEQSYKDVAKQILDSSDSDYQVIQELMNGSGNNDYKLADDFYNTITNTMGFDGIQTQWDFKDNDLKNKNANILIAFRSNQIKNVTNQNPTTNDDIRKSQNASEWRRFLDKNIKREGTGKTLDQIRTGPNRLSQVETTGEEGVDYWESQGADEKVAKVLSEKPKEPKKTIMEKIKEGIATLGDEIQQFNRKFVDKGETIYKLGKEKKNPSLYPKFDKMGTARAEAQYSIGNAQTDLNGKPFNNFTDTNGNKVPMSLEQIFEGTDPQTINEYIAHWINVDRYQQVNKAGRELQEQLDNQVKNGVITRQEANEIWDGQNSGELHKYVFGPNVTDEDSRRIIAEMEEKDPNLKRVGGNVWQYGRNQLQNRVDAGVISEREAAKFLQENPHYARLQRDVSEMNKGNVEFNKNGNAKVNKQIQEFEGSTLDILPFKDSMANYTIKTMEEMRTNEFAKELAKTIGVGSTTDTVNSIDEMFGVDYDIIKDNGDGTYSLTFFNNGTPTIIPINEGIYESLQPNKHFKYEDTTLFKGVRKFDNVRKALLTDKNPMFLATNMMKDAFDAPLNSKYPIDFVKNYPRAIKEIATNGIYFQQYQALGGLQNSYFADGEFKKQGSKYNPLTWIEKGNNAIEQFPRLAEFISTMEKTGDVNQAMYNAAEITTNFKRGGEITKSLNRNGATFLNASVQGFSKQVRNFTDIQSPKQAVQMLSKVVILGIAPALLNDLMWDDDDEYKEMQDYQKDRYYLFKGKDGNWIRIPKGRAVSIFQSAARRAKYYLKGDKKAFKGIGELTASQVAPNNPFENNIISPIVDVARNKAWSGNDIVSEAIKNKNHPEEEYTTKTDEFSKWLGKKLHKSPAKINYLLDQYSGAIGDVILPNITKNRKRDIENPFDVIANPFKDKFSTNAVTSSKAQNDFYDAYEGAESDKKWSKATPKDQARYKYLYAKNREISEIRKSIYEMYASNKSTKEKYEYNLEKQREINKIAREAVEQSKKIKTPSKNEIAIGDTRYTIANGKVNKLNDDVVKNANKYGLSIGDYVNITSKYSSIKADKDANGKSIAGSKKEKFIKYVNSRNELTNKQKIAIIKKYYKKYE